MKLLSSPFLAIIFARLVNLALRMSVLVFKFVFLLLVAKHWQTEDVGLYSLVVACVSYATYIVGLDYYTSSHRRFANANFDERSSAISEHVLVLLVTSGAFLLLVLSGWMVYGHGLIVATIAVLVLGELSCIEVSRYLVLRQKQLHVSLSLFIRHAMYGIVFIISLLGGDVLQLHTIFVIWALGSLVSSVLLVWVLVKTAPFRLNLKSVSVENVKGGLRVAGLFFFGTILIRSLFAIDKIAVGKLIGLEALGVYSFFVGISAAALAAYDALLGVYLLPSAFEIRRQTPSQVVEFIAGGILRCVGFYLFVTVAVYFMVDYFLLYIGKGEYLNARYILWYSLLSVVIYSLSGIFHVLCYVWGGVDRALTASAAVALGAFFSLSFVAYYLLDLGLLSFLLALNFAFALLLICKVASFLRLRNVN